MIGYAGTDAKVKWLKEELGFDFAFNYKKVNLSESLKEAAPEGVDVYYDNVSSYFLLCGIYFVNELYIINSFWTDNFEKRLWK